MKTICIKLIALVTILVTSSCRIHSTQEEFGPSRKQNVAVADFDEIDLSGTIRSLTKNVGTGSNVKEEKLTIGR